MKKFAILALAVGAFALTFVSLAPQSADAGWRRKAARSGWAPAGVAVQAGPRNGYYAPRRSSRATRGNRYPYAYYPYWRGRYYRGWY